MATRRHFTQEYRDQAVNLVLDSGRTVVEVANSIGIHEMTLGKWVKKAKESGQVLDKDLSESERLELERLRQGYCRSENGTGFCKLCRCSGYADVAVTLLVGEVAGGDSSA